ncbi:MAG: hypothetical protein ABEL76_10435, partial [Bradymonadaceae bacterium]
MRRSFLRKLLYWLILPGLIFCIVRLFLGYGTDSDTYRMLRTWQTMLLDGHYQASRAQGSLVGEFAIGALASVGGSVGSNAMVFVVALVGLGGLVRWLEDLGVAGGLGVVAVAMTNGLFVIEASTSMDYLLALSPFVLGILAMEREWDALAVVL